MILKILIFIFISNAPKVYSNKDSDIVKGQQMKYFKNCYEELGCIETTLDWYDDTHRPRNLEPLDRHTIRTEFILITTEADGNTHKPLKYETINLKEVSGRLAGYNCNKTLVILIHDFTSNGYTGWVKHIASIILNRDESNVISVDWEAGAEPPFEQAIANARVVALEVKALILMLKNSNSVNDQSIRIIGHGVGAHIAGYVGSCTSIEQITGLDPTGPFFEKMPPEVRLDQTDAAHVDVIHTDAFNRRSQGTQMAMGHVDFYVNGAQLQPDCNQSTQFPVFTTIGRDVLKEGTILPACSHKRSFKYFIEALENKDCEFTGIGCISYEEFVEGKCTSCKNTEHVANCATFGLTSVITMHTTRNFYLNTRGESPFCLNSYRVTMYFENNEKAKKYQIGNFELIMLNENGIMVNASTNYIGVHSSSHTFEAGKPRTLIYYASPPRVKKIMEARIKWIHTPNALCVVFCNKNVYVSRITIELLTTSKECHYIESQLCPARGKTEIENGGYVAFSPCLEDLTTTPATSASSAKTLNSTSTCTTIPKET